MGLRWVEGSALKGLGIGGHKPLGTPNDPLSVVVKNMAQGAAGGFSGDLAFLNAGMKSPQVTSSGGGLLRGLAGIATSVIPAFAAGGAIGAGTLSMVGERGPELFIPKTSGTIVPNHQLNNIGGTTHHWNVDARGSHDPAAVEEAVHRAVRKAAPGIVAGSLHAMREQTLRKPQTSR